MQIRHAAAAALIGLLAPAAGAQTIAVGESEIHGPHIVGPSGRPLYAFVTDVRAGDDLPALESCKQRCRRDWPPVAIADNPEAGEGIDESLISVVATDDLRVLSYNGYPLFYYHEDTGPGEPSGHAIHTYGGWWYLVAPDGEPIVTGILPETDG